MTTSDNNSKDLNFILSELTQARSLGDKVLLIQDLTTWMRSPFISLNPLQNHDPINFRQIRFKFLFQFLERNPAFKVALASAIQELIQAGSAIRLYSHAGMAEQRDFWDELGDRLVEKFIPHAYREKDLAHLFSILFESADDALWIETHYQFIVPKFIELMNSVNMDWQILMKDQNEALVILAADISSLGISREIRTRSKSTNLADSPFIKLNRALLADKMDSSKALEFVTYCRIELASVVQKANTHGVSVSLIYQIEKLYAQLERVEMILYLKQQADEETKNLYVAKFVSRLIVDQIERHSLQSYIKDNMHLLSRKIVEHSGEKGSHYIAQDKAGQKELWVAASWAGVLTAFTALIKGWIGKAGFPLFFEGFFFFLNYAFAFLMMQKFHLALSSKQPSFTASALAQKLEDFQKTKALKEVVLFARAISKSQLVTSLANLIWVIPLCILIDYLLLYLTGSHLFSAAEAEAVLQKHHPFKSLTLPFAFFTGVLLWASSVVSGWTENWVLYRRLPQLLENSHRLKNWMGEDRSQAFAANFSGIVGGIMGNLSIASFLAAPIIIGKFMGISLDIRHVTLATGTITFAWTGLPFDPSRWIDMINSLFSIVCIGLLNFGVSFYLSLRMASLARNIDIKYVKLIFRKAFIKE